MKVKKMRVGPHKIISIAVVCCLSNLIVTVRGEESEAKYVASEPLVLHTLPVHDRYIGYDTAGIFVDANGNVIVWASFGYRHEDKHKGKLLSFVLQEGTWTNTELVLPGYPKWRGMVNNGAFQAYAINIREGKKRSRIETVSVYSLGPDMRLSSRPEKIIRMDEGRKVFKGECSNTRHIGQLLPLEGTPDEFLITGHYVAERWNPIDVIRRVLSAGHWGFVTRPFAATAEQDEITGYYNAPQKLRTNECSRIASSIVVDDKVHCIGKKVREYHEDPTVIQYLDFDLSNTRWGKPVELFRGYKRGGELSQFFSRPCLTCDKETIYCVWSWTVRGAYDRSIRPKESGVYFCSKINNQWSEPIKLADLGVEPRVLVNNKGTVYVFWTERGKGVFYKRKTDGGWSETRSLIEDVLNRTKETGSPRSPTTRFSITADRNNNLHIIYIRESCGADIHFTPEELIYVKFTRSEE